MKLLERFREVWFGDFEWFARDGDLPWVQCAVFFELRSGRALRLTGDELRMLGYAPFDVGPKTLFVSFFASAEMGCFLALGWPMPAYVICLYAEFRVYTNRTQERGKKLGANLLNALAWFGLPVRSGSTKEAGRALALSSSELSASQMEALIDYCADDVEDDLRLLKALIPHIHRLDQALFRGRYMKSVARMEHHGIPIDGDLYRRVLTYWAVIKSRLIREVDRDFGVFEDTAFKEANFARYLDKHRILWPCNESGRLRLDKDTFKAMAIAHPQLESLRQLRKTLAQVGKRDLPLGSDGALRGLLSPFGTVTGRNAPGRYIFSAPKWVRGFVCPPRGRTLVYLDWKQQEIAIAAELSQDGNLRNAYRSGDVYLFTAKLAAAVPEDATAVSHPFERGQYKTVTLATNYGSTEWGIANQLDISVTEARFFLEEYRAIYPDYWRWNRAVVDTAFSTLRLTTKYGWTLRVTEHTNDRKAGNWMVQSTGSEMMRLAACRLTDAGIRVCGPAHDAFLIEVDSDMPEVVDAVVGRAIEIMRGAARTVIGYHIECSEQRVTACGDLMEEKSMPMWRTVMRLLEEAESET